MSVYFADSRNCREVGRELDVFGAARAARRDVRYLVGQTGNLLMQATGVAAADERR